MRFLEHLFGSRPARIGIIVVWLKEPARRNFRTRVCRLGSYVNAAAALGASRLEAEAANHAGYVFEVTAVSWIEQCGRIG